MDPYLVTMLLTCTALQLPLPVHVSALLALICGITCPAIGLRYIGLLQQDTLLEIKGYPFYDYDLVSACVEQNPCSIYSCRPHVAALIMRGLCSSHPRPCAAWFVHFPCQS